MKEIDVDKREVTRAFQRVLEHEAFRNLHRKPRLTVRQYDSPRGTHGRATYGFDPKVSINIWPELDEFDVEETIIHEIVHHLAHQSGERGHGWLFNRTMDDTFDAIHPEAIRYLKPRRNRYHGRYADALRTAHEATAAARTQSGIDQLLEDVAATQEAAQRLLTPEEPALAATEEAKPSILDRVFFGMTPEQLAKANTVPQEFFPPGRRTRIRETTTTMPTPDGPYRLTRNRGPVARGGYRLTRDEIVYSALSLRGTTGNGEKPGVLAQQLGISEGQVRHALWRLRNEGRVENHRRGWWRVTGR